MRFIQILAFVMAALVCAFAPAYAEKRVALVIGNNSYANLPANEQLQKAVNDARAVGGALKAVGFDVIQGENLGRSALLGRFDTLMQRLEPGDIAFFFFAGHGVALDGANYILPADVPNVVAGQEARLKGEAIGESYIAGELTGRGVRVAVVVLDACRNNPFARSGRSVGGARGLAAPPQVSGVFSLYSASSGQEAMDRLFDGDPNPNSVFTRVLVPMLGRPGLDLTDLARDVRDEVMRIAANAGLTQRPAYYDETAGGRFYLAGLPPPGGQAAVTPPPGGSTLISEAAQVWETVKNATDIGVIDGFLGRYGTVPVYGDLARAKRTELQKVVVVVPTAPPPQRDAPLTPERERGLKRGDTFRECADCPEMVVVPPGSFKMGSPDSEKDRSSNEGPQHAVTILQPFAVGKFHVTVDQFSTFVRETGYAASTTCLKIPTLKSDGSWRDPGFMQEGSHPVVCVSWADANAYANWLVKKTGRPYRLLSEAEFEYAARAGTTTPYWWGSTVTPAQAKYAGSGTGTVPVNSFQPNPWGLYNVHGNADQWTADCYHDSYTGAPTDGAPWTAGNCGVHVVRGGFWYSYPQGLGAAYRFRGTGPAMRSDSALPDHSTGLTPTAGNRYRIYPTSV